MTEEVTLTINETSVTVPKGTTVYHAVKNLGIDIPIFCYQDRMPPFGACRVCLVEVEKMPKLQTSCTLVATEGMVVKTHTGKAVEGRKEILEFLLINHPLDCPICDKGGECPLQDQTIKFGPGTSRFTEDKRHFVKALPVGPVLMLDRERCIVCARCTRFGDEIAGDHALEMKDRGYKTEVGPAGGSVQSKFIGNTISICPVGALTSQVYRFRARPWDNDQIPSTCTLCPVGCSLVLDSRDGELMRTRSCENKELNDIWLCDKGWFGYEFTSNLDRLRSPLIRKEGTLQEASWDEALDLVASKIKEAHGKAAGLGGNPLTVEENYLFQGLMRQGAKTANVDHRVGETLFSLNEEGLPPGMLMRVGDCENLKHVYMLGLDLTEEFPVIWLRLKQAFNRGAKSVFIGHYRPEIANYFTKTLIHAPGEELDMIKQHVTEKEGVIFVGRQWLASQNRADILDQLALLGLPLQVMEGRGNSLGARFAGMHPELEPGAVKAAKPGLNAHQSLEAATRSELSLLYVAGANPQTKYKAELWKAARKGTGFLVVQDIFLTETAKEADVVLPTLTFVEKEGSFLNIEKRMQRLQVGKEIPENIKSDKEIFMLLLDRLNVKLPAFDVSMQQIEWPKIERQRVQPSTFAKEGLKATFAPALFDRGVRMEHNPHVSKLVKEPTARLHPVTAAAKGIQDKSLIRLNHAVTLKAEFDLGVAQNTVVLPLGFPEIKIQELGSPLLNGLIVECQNV